MKNHTFHATSTMIVLALAALQSLAQSIYEPYSFTTFAGAKSHATKTVSSPDRGGAPIPLAELGAKAGAQYQGDGLSVLPAPEGARLRCVFQKLDAQATSEGLWLVSTVDGAKGDRFRIVATSVGREDSSSAGGARHSVRAAALHNRDSAHGVTRPTTALARTGTVTVAEKVARFVRPGLVEEYSVSMDGVRQDFLVLQRPDGDGKLRVELDVTGAKAEALVTGARLALDRSGRKIAYSRLRVVDAHGRELAARLEVASANCLAVLVDDAKAVYPVRIDPTFSDANWVSMGAIQGPNGSVSATVVDGSGNLYIAGDFTIVGDVIANRIAKWNGSSWTALDSGMGGPPDTYVGVSALALSGNDLYVGGNFTTAGGSAATNIAKWNGSAWSALGSGVDGYPAALAVSGSDLYVGGSFTTAGGSAATNIAKWNGSSWSALGSGMGGVTYPIVYALAVSGSDLYVGGNFTTAGGSAATNIAKWNGSSWSVLGSGMGGGDYPYEGVLALAVLGSDLYVGGNFTTAGGSAATNIAKWNGSAWSALGLKAGFRNQVGALAVSGTDLYVGGLFTTPGGTGPIRVAKWDGSAWSALGSGVLGNNINYAVVAVAVSGTDLYVGGDFTMSGVSHDIYIAKWNWSEWSALGSESGLNNEVSGLAVSGNDLYVGGNFTTAGGSAATNIAKWNGSAWSALGLGVKDESGLNGGVHALAVSGSDLYVGGYFTTAGGSAANNIAKWNGSVWSALGLGVKDESFLNDGVQALAVSGTNLYVGGFFTTAGGSAITNIAKWDGSKWAALGSGLSGGFYGPTVYALAVSGTNLYVGGGFTVAGGAPATRAAKWDGSAWSALGSGLNADVLALAVSGPDLYASGRFDTAGASAANSIAKWDGRDWSALGSGLDNWAFALAVSGTDLYVGGYFVTAGDKVSPYLARAILPPALTIARSGNNAVLSWASPTVGFALEQNLRLGTANWTNVPVTPSDDGTNKSATIPLDSAASFFRLKK